MKKLSRDDTLYCQDYYLADEADAVITELQEENVALRARNERLKRELAQLAESVAQRLEQAGAGMQAGLIREVFIQKSHP